MPLAVCEKRSTRLLNSPSAVANATSSILEKRMRFEKSLRETGLSGLDSSLGRGLECPRYNRVREHSQTISIDGPFKNREMTLGLVEILFRNLSTVFLSWSFHDKASRAY